MDQQYMDKYWEQLRNMGFSEDMINLYKQQVEQSMSQADSWNAQMSVFTENIKQFNQMFELRIYGKY